MAQLQDVIRFQPLRAPDDTRTQTLIYLLPGNPGFVEYYRNFLKYVYGQLNGREISVCGASHIGFHVENGKELSSMPSPPYSLQEVIDAQKVQIRQEVDRIRGDHEEVPVQIILMGHSVGSYMLLEITDWWRKQAHYQNTPIVGGICLFPTVVDIAKSPRGKVMSWLLAFPLLPILAQLAAQLLGMIPLSLWNWAKALTPGDDPSLEYQRVTESVISTRSGMSARQAAYMAHGEMLSIQHDKWHPANIWGNRTETSTEDHVKPARLFFYWGDNDYWVDNQIRDRLIQQRASRENDVKTKEWPKMVIDQHSMDHCFSLNEEHGAIVASQVVAWVEEVIKSAARA